MGIRKNAAKLGFWSAKWLHFGKGVSYSASRVCRVENAAAGGSRTGFMVRVYGAGNVRSFSDDLSSLLEQNALKTRKPDVRRKADNSKPDVKPDMQHKDDDLGLLGFQFSKSEPGIQTAEVPAESVEPVEDKPELLPVFGSDEELIEHVTSVLNEVNWSELHGKLALLGDQVKVHHVPEILKRAKGSNVLFSFLKWSRARKHVDMDPSILKLMFDILSETDKAEEMQWLLEEMHTKGLQLDDSMCIVVMKAYGRVKRLDDAVRVFERMENLGCRPRTSSYNCILQLLYNAGYNLKFDVIFSKMKILGRALNSSTYETVIAKTCRSGKADEAYKLFEEMKGKDYAPTAAVYASLVECFSKAGQESLAFEILGQMENPGEEVYNPMVLNLVQAGKLGVALAQYKKMLEAGVKPFSSTCIAILSELVVTEKATQAYTLFGEMAKVGYIALSDVVPVVNNSYRKCKVEIVWNFLKELTGKGCQFDADTIHSLIHGLVEKKRVDLARKMFRSVIDAGKKPSTATYNLFIKNLTSTDATKQIFDLMKQNGCKPDVNTYNGMIESLSKGGLLSEAYDFFSEMMEKGYEANAVTYKLVVELLSKNETMGADATIEALTTLNEKGRFQGAGSYLGKLSEKKLLPTEKQKGIEGKVLVKILQNDGKRFDDVYM